MELFSSDSETMVMRFVAVTLSIMGIVSLNTFMVLYTEYGQYALEGFSIDDFKIAADKNGATEKWLYFFLLFQAMSFLRFIHMIKKFGARYVMPQVRWSALFSCALMLLGVRWLWSKFSISIALLSLLIAAWMLFFTTVPDDNHGQDGDLYGE